MIVAVLDKEYLVPVAPAWYLMNKAVLGQDQTINIAGVMLKSTGTSVILPKWIKTGNEYIYLRNYDGTTFWEVSDDYKAYTKSADTKDHSPGQGGHGGHAGH